MAPSRGHNSTSGDLFHMKLTKNIEQKLGKTIQALFAYKAAWFLPRLHGQKLGLLSVWLNWLEKAIVTKQ